MIHTARLTNKTELAEGTMAFYFEKPNNFRFQPGQFVDLTLIDPPETDGEGNKRSFSIAADLDRRNGVYQYRDAHEISRRADVFNLLHCRPSRDGCCDT
jgi:ferredoxin-NADP reductase